MAVPRWPLLARLRGRHALVRAVDRVEAAVLVLAFFVSLIALPVAGAVGTAAYDALSHRHTGSAATQAATGGVLIWAGTTVAAVALFIVTRALCDRVRQSRWDKGLHDLSEETS
ncbi:hypothetical protein KUF57_01870 [Mycolicibacterium sp. PAM1]|nr:hypothetical protein [Mycolicibacterium sp. PAM1]MCV7054057.1 hypothetical protein [Mycolicibacterium gilvum]